MSNVLTFPLSLAEGILTALGEELAELGGVRLTRLASQHSAGATTLDVETTFSSKGAWPDAGTLYIDGEKYTYTGRTTSPPEFTGLSPALVTDLPPLTSVADGSDTFSLMGLMRNMLRVDTAESEFLDALGRFHGIGRISGQSDIDFRSLIQTLAYASRGTTYVIEQVLELLVGAGNFTIFEDLINFPNEVFISFDEEAIFGAGVFQGKSFFSARETKNSTTTTSVAIDSAPVEASRNNVDGVYLAPELIEANLDVKPSAETDAWTYSGVLAEGTAVTDNTDGSHNIDDGGTVADTAFYERNFRIEPSSEKHIAFKAKVNSHTASDNRSIALVVHDSLIAIGLHIEVDKVVLFNQTSGAAVATSATLAGGSVAREYRLIHRSSADPGGPSVGAGNWIEVWRDEELVLRTDYAGGFGASASRKVEFGSFSTTGSGDADWYYVRVAITKSRTNYFNGYGTGNTSSGDIDRVTDGGTNFTATDSDRRIRVEAISPSLTSGRIDGTYEITAVDAGGTYVDVQGVTHDADEVCDVVSADQVRLPADTWDGFELGDLVEKLNHECGIPATLTTGTVGNSDRIFWTAVYGGDIGENISVRYIHASPVAVQVTVIDGGGGFVEDIEITLNNSIHTAADVITAVRANPVAAAMVNLELAPEAGTGVPPVLAATNLTGGHEGKLFTIAGSVLGNDGTYPLSTRIDEFNALLGNHRTAAALTAEPGVTWRKDPNFATSGMGVDWEIPGGGSLSGTTLTLREALPSSPISVTVVYSDVLSAQILRNFFTPNAAGPTHYPFYLADPLAYLRTLIDSLTVAGVIANYPSTTPLNPS